MASLSFSSVENAGKSCLVSTTANYDQLHVIHVFMIEAMVRFAELSIKTILNTTPPTFTYDFDYLTNLAYHQICYDGVATRANNRLYFYQDLRCESLTGDLCRQWAKGQNIRREVLKVLKRKQAHLGLAHLSS